MHELRARDAILPIRYCELMREMRSRYVFPAHPNGRDQYQEQGSRGEDGKRMSEINREHIKRLDAGLNYVTTRIADITQILVHLKNIYSLLALRVTALESQIKDLESRLLFLEESGIEEHIRKNQQDVKFAHDYESEGC